MGWATVKVEFKPGVIADSSELASEGGYVSANNVRWRRGYAQTIGGWEKLTASTFTGIARGGKAWSDLDGTSILAFGVQANLYAYVGGSLVDITPYKAEARLGTDPFHSMEGSATITATYAGHGLVTGDVFWSDLDGTPSSFDKSVTAVLSTSQFQYAIGFAADSTEDFGSVDGLNPYFVAPLDEGPVDAGSGVQPRVWSIDNFGEMMVAVPSGGKLYAGYIQSDYPELIRNGTFTSVTDEWAVSNDTSWVFAGNAATIARTSSGTSSGNLSQNIQGRVKAGHSYRLKFNYVRTAGRPDSQKLRIAVNAGDPAAEIDILPETTYDPGDGGVTLVVPFVCPSQPVDLVFYGEVTTSDTTSRGISIDNVTMEEIPVSPIDQAPSYTTAMFVDPNRIVVLLGTVEADGDYNPMLVRWSGQENIRQWVPDDDNLAGEYPLAKGGRIVGGLPTRQQNLVWTDESLYSMQFTGSAGDGFAFRLLGSGCGLIATHAAAEQNGVAFWMGSDGNFYIFQGAVPQIIDCPLRDYVFGNLNTAQQAKIYAGINSTFSEVWWFYPRDEETECSHYVSFNWIEQQWSHGEMDRTTWLASGIFSNPIAFDTSGHIYKQESGGKADGETLEWSLETGFSDIEDGDRLLAISEYRCDHAYQTGSIKISFSFRNDAISGRPATEGPHVVEATRKRLQFRRMGRQMKIKWQNGDDCEGWRDGVKAVVIQKTGAAR
jgi:hypothetical protein